MNTVPHSLGVDKPSLNVPKDACDCHMHLFDNRVPFAKGTQLIHPDATVEDYQALQKRLGLSRCVIVQPSSYGLDNRVMLSGLQKLGKNARGIAVVTPEISNEELRFLHSQDVVGVRFNLVQTGATDTSMLEAVAQRIKEFGWHIQVHLRNEDLLKISDRLSNLGVDVVLDHFARARVNDELADSIDRIVNELMSTGNVWIKLSGAYIASKKEPDFNDLDSFVDQLLKQHGDRIVWGTDWPHVTESVKPNDASLINLLARWIPDEQTRNNILVQNPKNLYQF